ncbi:mediator complex, subunit Med16 [Podospora didyma]|uniref:Mediator of RNA polymerase II transcription subunit 16 n=1 Tax=Podospora didyma TaxID=330526 RepID=A0AAE0N6T3_9PEZI|nr:mediator complex, subunit Med16 [Podospora didyma]
MSGAHDMPGLLLGDGLGVDADMHDITLHDVDLFGDPVMDSTLALPTRPLPSKQLLQRLDELRTRGCCQGIAWSRQGTIASITPDGKSIDLRFLRCRPDSGTWELTSSNPWSTVSPPLQGGPIVHLAWASTSSPELAVIDAVGRVTILSFSITLNRSYSVRRWDSDPVDDLHAVVGCYWLPLVSANRSFNVTHGQAVWNQSDYRYDNFISPSMGPFHPNPGKSALLCITTNGFLKLFFSQNSNRIEETDIELENITSSEDLITHSAMCSDKNTVLIAMATASKQLKIVRAIIHWGLPQPTDKQAPPGSMPLHPTIKDSHVAVTSWLQHGAGNTPLDASMTQLSHIELLPAAVEGQPPTLSPPLVLTVRSFVPNETSPFSQEPQSIIDRWGIHFDQSQSLHPAFEQLGSKNAPRPPPLTPRLRKLESIIMPKIIVSIHQLQLGKVLCFVFSDGTLQYRDRITMNETLNETNITHITSLHHVGFQFFDASPCLQVAFSPTNCSFVQVCEDGTLKWNRLNYPMEDPTVALQDPSQYHAVLAGLSLALAPSAVHQTNCDDILAIARPFSQKTDFTYAWIREIVKLLKFSVDYSEESHHDQLVRNHHLQLCLSILNHLGFRGEFEPRSFGGKFAMLALNVRNIVILITIASNTPINLKGQLSPLDEPEVVEALAGCAKWAVDLLSWMTDCLYRLLDDPIFMSILSDPKRFPELANYLQSQGDVSLHLLLCSSTRGFLSAACRRLTHLQSLCTRATQFYKNASRPPSPLKNAYEKMQHSTSSSLVKVHKFDNLVGGLSEDIRSAYRRTLSGLVSKPKPQNGTGNTQQGQDGNEQLVKKAQAHCELDMLLAANPPPGFREVLFNFFNTSLPNFRVQTDPARLYFGNYDLLEVEDNPKILAAKKTAGKYIDVFKRVEIYSGAGTVKNALSKNGGHANGAGEEEGPRWRRCVRCASVMEDVYGQRPGFTFVLAQQRKCSCGGNWGLLPRGSLVT